MAMAIQWCLAVLRLVMEFESPELLFMNCLASMISHISLQAKYQTSKLTHENHVKTRHTEGLAKWLAVDIPELSIVA